MRQKLFYGSSHGQKHHGLHLSFLQDARPDLEGGLRGRSVGLLRAPRHPSEGHFGDGSSRTVSEEIEGQNSDARTKFQVVCTGKGHLLMYVSVYWLFYGMQ